jgi:hypothetical protein
VKAALLFITGLVAGVAITFVWWCRNLAPTERVLRQVGELLLADKIRHDEGRRS